MSASEQEQWAPRATYRLQLHAGFTFRDLEDIVPYLAALGVSHCYCSPYLKARPGSLHGYDIVDHGVLNPEIGSREDLERLGDTLSDHGMSQILDIVPNHIAVMGRDNPWWLDVLENGQASEFADFFDIDWYPLRKSLTGKVLMPVLGEHYGEILDSGELELVFDREQGAFALEYYEHLFPIDPREYPRILSLGLDALKRRNLDETVLVTFESLITAFGNLPERWQQDEDKLNERRRDKEVHKRRLARIVNEHGALAEYIEERLERFNQKPRGAESVRLLHELLEAQAYRLAYWRVASHEINYRRFFDINELASLRMEHPPVFDAAHRLVLELAAEGRIQGVRVDHPDGLYDPAGYFRRLWEELTRTMGGRTNGPRRPYVVAEKILAHNEPLRSGWRVHGTTGYDFAALIGRLFVYPNGMPQLDKLYSSLVEERTSLKETAYRAKKLIMQTSLASELNVLLSELDRIAEADPHTRDFGLGGLRSALVEIVAWLGVYRTYVASMKVSKADIAFVDEAVAAAKRRVEAADTSVFDFVGDVLTLRAAEGRSDAYRRRLLAFVMKLQQYTGPAAAKGVEDTAFYRYNRLVSLNEVGGEPDSSSLSIEAFHRANLQRLKQWPHALLASSTHDNKRSEDVRSRISVLSELSSEWSELVSRWVEDNARFKLITDDNEAWPEHNTEYFLYQTLIGAWPLETPEGEALESFAERIRAYMNKAAKEAKTYTSWINQNEAYEQAVGGFVDALLKDERADKFRAELGELKTRVARIGMYSGLSQTLLRLTVPGVPDIYQGNELWTFDLVDPDNRRPVDFSARRAKLEALRDATVSPEHARALIERVHDGDAKLYVLHKALELRRERPRLFAEGEYVALNVGGQLQVYLCAFARRHGSASVVVLAPRWFASLSDGGRSPPLGEDVWKDATVELPASETPFRDVFSGREVTSSTQDGTTINAAHVLSDFPVALLYNGA